MRRASCLLLMVLFSGGSLAAEEPRALIQRALKARGGSPTQHIAAQMRIKGKAFDETSPVGQLELEGELFEDKGRSKLDVKVTSKAPKMTMQLTLVNNDKDSWAAMNGQRMPSLNDEELARSRLSQYVDEVTELAVVLTDRGFTLAPLDDTKVEGRPARGVKVSRKDRPDISLYFDRETGLLVKYSYRGPEGKKKDALHETVISDYRQPDLAAADEKLLRAAKIDVTDAALLAFLRERTPSAKKVERVRTLIAQLGDDAFEVREKASRDLIALGPIALGFLREAAKSEDREVARRARECLEKIGEDRSKVQAAAVVRLLGVRRPARTAEVLLNYLPRADAEVARELQAALYAVAQAVPAPDPVLVRALEDKNPMRRRAAAAALGKDGGVYARQPGRRLFGPVPKRSCKHKSWLDGKLHMEWEQLDYQFFNAFEDKVFAKP